MSLIKDVFFHSRPQLTRLITMDTTSRILTPTATSATKKAEKETTPRVNIKFFFLMADDK